MERKVYLTLCIQQWTPWVGNEPTIMPNRLLSLSYRGLDLQTRITWMSIQPLFQWNTNYSHINHWICPFSKTMRNAAEEDPTVIVIDSQTFRSYTLGACCYTGREIWPAFQHSTSILLSNTSVAFVSTSKITKACITWPPRSDTRCPSALMCTTSHCLWRLEP